MGDGILAALRASAAAGDDLRVEPAADAALDLLVVSGSAGDAAAMAAELMRATGVLALGDAAFAAEVRRRAGPGAFGWLPVDVDAPRLAAAARAVAFGLDVTPAGTPVPDVVHASVPSEPLTARELEVFELLAKGLGNRDIGQALGISHHTAKFHVAQILAKTGAATRTEAVRQGLRQGLVGL